MHTMDYAGITIDLESEIITDRIEEALRYGSYELEETQFIELYLENDVDVIELGGGIGYLSCYANKRLGESQTHVVVEPNGSLLPLIERHRTLNEADFKILNAAYSTQTPIATLSLSDDFWTASTQKDEHAGRVVHTGTIDLETLIEWFDLSNPVVIVDIEGAEVDLIENELDVLKAHCSLLIIEFHYENQPSLELASRIRWAKGTLDTSEFTLIDDENTVAVYRAPEK